MIAAGAAWFTPGGPDFTVGGVGDFVEIPPEELALPAARLSSAQPSDQTGEGCVRW